jgi:hypothetical protein
VNFFFSKTVGAGNCLQVPPVMTIDDVVYFLFGLIRR